LNRSSAYVDFVPDLRFGRYGIMQLNADGHWVYTAYNVTPETLQQLAPGEEVREHFSVGLEDGGRSTLTIVLQTPAGDAGAATGNEAASRQVRSVVETG